MTHKSVEAAFTYVHNTSTQNYSYILHQPLESQSYSVRIQNLCYSNRLLSFRLDNHWVRTNPSIYLCYSNRLLSFRLDNHWVRTSPSIYLCLRHWKRNLIMLKYNSIMVILHVWKEFMCIGITVFIINYSRDNIEFQYQTNQWYRI